MRSECSSQCHLVDALDVPDLPALSAWNAPGQRYLSLIPAASCRCSTSNASGASASPFLQHCEREMLICCIPFSFRSSLHFSLLLGCRKMPEMTEPQQQAVAAPAEAAALSNQDFRKLIASTPLHPSMQAATKSENPGRSCEEGGGCIARALLHSRFRNTRDGRREIR